MKEGVRRCRMFIVAYKYHMEEMTGTSSIQYVLLLPLVQSQVISVDEKSSC